VNALRDYQQGLYIQARQALTTSRAVCIQLATGGGKTPVMSAMCESVYGKHKTAWILVNRKELLTQASAHLLKWNVPHNMIKPGRAESNAFRIHLVSSDTLIRRYDKIKRWPDLIIFDECHLTLDRQIEIVKRLPEHTKIIGFTATPERGDGRGLSVKAGGVYDELITGPSIPELTEQGYLSGLRYFSPPLEGLSSLKVRGTDYDEEQLEELLKRRKVYGELVGHYAKYGVNPNGTRKPALIFCRSIKSADHTAERFRDKGFNFHNIDSTMTDTRRAELVAALTAGTIDGLTGCDIFTYGIDIPRVEYGATIRPTLSRALYMQAIGRVLRPFRDGVTGYRKEEALFFDHVNNILEHQDDRYPGVPLHYVPEISWNFDGVDKRKRDKKQKNVILCPHLDFMYCDKGNCATCQHNPDKSVTDARKPMIVIPAALVEAPRPVPMAERAPDDQREIQDRIGAAILEYKRDMSPGPVGELLKIAESLKRQPMWVYYELTSEDRKTINIPLLHEIARQKKYDPKWVYFRIKEARMRKAVIKDYREAMR